MPTLKNMATTYLVELQICILISLLLLLRSDNQFSSAAYALQDAKHQTSALTDFENSFNDEARTHLASCTSIEDEGFRAECSLLAALDAQTTAVKHVLKSNAEIDIEPDTCSYRLQGGPLLHRYASKMSPYLKQVLVKYKTMHRYCTGLEFDSLADKYRQRRRPECRYIIWSCTFGLGNKLMSLLSTFLYAILSQRVLLIESPGWGDLFCEPFAGSKLQVPEGLSLKEDESPTFAQFQEHNCKESTESYCRGNVVKVVFSGVSTPIDHSFLVCPTAMAAIKNVPFLNFRNSNQHFAVGFYLNPALRPLLERMFPEHNVFHMLAQTLLNPSGAVWSQIKSFHVKYLSPATRNIGVQLRESKGEYRQYFDEVVPLCIQKRAALCPIEMEEQLERDQANASSPEKNFTPINSVYISSLVGGHYIKLKESIVKMETEMRQRFVVVAQVKDLNIFSQKSSWLRKVKINPAQIGFDSSNCISLVHSAPTCDLEAEGEQRENVGHLQKALVDMWVLSLSDILLTSHMSTFGYTAQGLAGLTPYHLKPWLDNACWLSVSSDPCFHFAPKRVECPADNFTLEDPFKEVPYINKCPDLPKTGLQLSG